ncbi:hypothetical protein [Kitasatospora aureofaciens]|uniref:hypothetical protein n=1 Tax=Kitasatospora aureofaciens TaxID=1894 RepID=UPI003806E4C8
MRAALLRPPLYQRDYAYGLGTVYTAVYRPGLGEVDYLWPGGVERRQSFAAFDPGTRAVTLE